MVKFHFGPSVFPVTSSAINPGALKAFVELEGINKDHHPLKDFMGATLDKIPEVAGRLCYFSFENPRPGGNKAYIKHILDVNHGSVLEHSNLGVIVCGISRSLSHELVRHRAGMSYSQLSQRYVDESDMEIVVPPEDAKRIRNYLHNAVGTITSIHSNNLWIYDEETSETLPQKLCSYWVDVGSQLGTINDVEQRRLDYAWLCQICQCFENYKQKVDFYMKQFPADMPKEEKTAARKSIRGTARSILPNCTETKIMVTGNVRSWRHFLGLRGNKGADIEIRNLAFEIYRQMKEFAPNCVQDLEFNGEEIVRVK